MKIKKGKKAFHRSLSDRPGDLRNLFARLITTLFKVFGSLIESYNHTTFSLLSNLEKEGSRL